MTVIYVVLLYVFIDDILMTSRIMDIYDVQRGTLLWLGCTLTIASATFSVLCLLFTPWLWTWAILLWSFLVSLVALLGFRMGLNPDFATRWEVFLPWALLVVSFVFEKPFGRIQHS